MIATLRTHMKLVVTRRNGFATSARLFKLLNACRRVTPVVCCSLRDVCEELRGTGRDWEELGGIRRNWEELGGIERNWEELGGTGRNWEELGGNGRKWEDLGGTGGKWEEMGGTRRN